MAGIILEEDMLDEYKFMKHKLFQIGEILVDESKWHITSEKAIEKIRKVMQEKRYGMYRPM